MAKVVVRVARAIALCCCLTGVAGCSDDNTRPRATEEQRDSAAAGAPVGGDGTSGASSPTPDAGVSSTGHASSDAGNNVVKPDAGGSNGTTDQGPNSGGSSGAGFAVMLCTSDTSCKAGESCLIPSWQHTTGICTANCEGIGKNSPCVSAERKKHGLAEMCIAGSVTRTSSDGKSTTTTYSACGFICKDEFGKTYNCPAGTRCWVQSPNHAICVPPQ